MSKLDIDLINKYTKSSDESLKKLNEEMSYINQQRKELEDKRKYIEEYQAHIDKNFSLLMEKAEIKYYKEMLKEYMLIFFTDDVFPKDITDKFKRLMKSDTDYKTAEHEISMKGYGDISDRFPVTYEFDPEEAFDIYDEEE